MYLPRDLKPMWPVASQPTYSTQGRTYARRCSDEDTNRSLKDLRVPLLVRLRDELARRSRPARSGSTQWSCANTRHSSIDLGHGEREARWEVATACGSSEDG